MPVGQSTVRLSPPSSQSDPYCCTSPSFSSVDDDGEVSAATEAASGCGRAPDETAVWWVWLWVEPPFLRL